MVSRTDLASEQQKKRKARDSRSGTCLLGPGRRGRRDGAARAPRCGARWGWACPPRAPHGRGASSRAAPARRPPRASGTSSPSAAAAAGEASRPVDPLHSSRAANTGKTLPEPLIRAAARNPSGGSGLCFSGTSETEVEPETRTRSV
jgi:hypothetical protein